MGADGSEKRLILILNKNDLVPGMPERVVGLSPQILPNSTTKGEQVCCEFSDIYKFLTVQGTSATLLEALKSFAHAKQHNRLISVGVIGYPNVGKLSVINLLTGRLGGLQEVKLDKKLKMVAQRTTRHTSSS